VTLMMIILYVKAFSAICIVELHCGSVYSITVIFMGVFVSIVFYNWNWIGLDL
jgi:hypothetical protein